MSTVHVHIGQCGNQLSVPLWRSYRQCKTGSSKSLFTSLDGWHRSVHVDSESKVVNALPKIFKVREQNVIIGKRGRGTNFALGFHGMTSAGDDHVLEHSLDAIRREVEKCDMFSGTVVYHSLSGGTGSGLGAHIIELLRDCYPCNYIMSCAVAPCVSGESPLQSYNALLAMHWLQQHTDSIILLQNDLYISYLSKLARSAESDERGISFEDINRVIASNLSGVLLPTNSLSTPGGAHVGDEPWELVRTLTPMPATKFITLSQHTSSKLSWDGLTSKTLQCHPKYSGDGRQFKTLSATVVARGDRENSFMSAVKSGLDRKIRKGLGLVNWNPYPLDCWTAKQNMTSSKQGSSSSSVTIAANSSCVADHLETILSRSRAKLEAGAYLHWYHKYGVSKDQFNECMETLESVISEYEAATAD